MRRCTLLAVALATSALPLSGWMARVAAPRNGLPDIDVVAGYPGQYLPERHCPIELRVDRAGQPFDGYLGVHLAVGNKRTLAVASLLRAKIAAGGSWRGTLIIREVFTGAPTLDRPARDIVIEWRDRDAHIVATATAGAPQWSPSNRPLRILAPDEQPREIDYFGEKAVPLPIDVLSNEAEWYAGFSSVVMPTRVWFALNDRVREAMFHALSSLVFIGVPATVPPYSRIDDAVIPVDFTGASVRPKRDTSYLVTNGVVQFVKSSPGSNTLWSRDDETIRAPLPAVDATLVLPSTPGRWSTKWSPADVARLIRKFLPAVVGGLAVIASIILWRLTRKNAWRPVLAIALVVACAQPLYRDALARRSGSTVVEAWLPLREGVVQHQWIQRVFGNVPLNVSQRTEASVVNSGLNSEWMARPASAELIAGNRRLATFGDVDYAYARRVATRIELSSDVRVHMRDITPTAITFDYSLSRPARRALMVWTAGGKRHKGSTDLDGSSGRATIKSGLFNATWDAALTWDFSGLNDEVRYNGRSNQAAVAFLCGTPLAAVFNWRGDIPPTETFMPYSTLATLRRDPAGRPLAEVVLPDADLPADSMVRLSAATAAYRLAGNGVTFEGDRGTLVLPPAIDFTYRLTAAQLRRICTSHSLLRIHFSVAASPNESLGSVLLTVGATRA